MTPFQGFMPDADPTTPGVITDVTNMVPTIRGSYVGASSGADVGMDALAAAALSAVVVTNLTGTNRLFAGTTTKLYEKSVTAWDDVSRVAAYGATTTNPWRFAQFGNTTLAVNKTDQIQSISSGTDFANLTAPSASLMCVNKGFVIVADTNNGGAAATYGDSPDRWWCSAYMDETDWVISVTTQCTTGRIVDTPGAIKALRALGDYVIAYKATSLYVGSYQDAPTVWAFDLVSSEVGCSSQEAIVEVNNSHYFVGDDDFYRYAPGNLPQAVGAPVKEWFFSRCDPAYKGRIRAAHDRVNALIYWFYPPIGSSGSLTACVVYNYQSNRWGVADKSIECVTEYVSGGYTYASLPFGTYDTWPEIPYDSPFWDANSKYVAYVGTDHKIYSMTAASSSSSLTTGHYGTDNEFTLLNRVTLRYLDKPTTATMTNYYLSEHGGTWTTDTTTTESSGRFDVMRSAPWHKVTFNFTGDLEVVGASAVVQADGVY